MPQTRVLIGTASVAAIAALCLTQTAVSAPKHSFGSQVTTASAGEVNPTFEVTGKDVAARVGDIARIGAAIEHSEDASKVIITASPREQAAIKKLGLGLTRVKSSAEIANEYVAAQQAEANARGEAITVANEFPKGYEAYHTYEEMNKVLDDTVKKYPTLAAKSSTGKTEEKRDQWIMKIGADVNKDRDVPEVVLTCNVHAREHLTTEMCLYLINELTSKYKSDERIKKIVDSRVIWIVPMQNPDGSTYDISGGKFQGWRKDRYKNSDGSYGIDTNRNYGYKWGCCEGSSTDPTSDTYRGPKAFASLTTKNLADFIKKRNVGGKQRVKAFADIHTFSELVMWPYGYTKKKAVDGMSQDQYSTHEALGKKMAKSNGFTPQQGSSLYVSDGSSFDWTFGDQKIFSWGFELYPKGMAGDGFYPKPNVIGKQTERNREAFLTMMEYADCAYRIIGKEDQYCKGAKPTKTKPN